MRLGHSLKGELPEYSSRARVWRRSVSVTGSGIAYDRSSPRGGVPVLFIHAGIAECWWDVVPVEH